MIRSWSKITCALAWKLRKQGFVLSRKDLILPPDKVLVDEDITDGLAFKFIGLKAAELLITAQAVRGEKAGVLALESRWQKIGACLLWKYAKNGCQLLLKDFEAVPLDKVLLAHGHADDIEYRFVDRLEARRIAAYELDNEGKVVTENA